MLSKERLNRTVAYALSRREAYLIVGLVFAAVVVAIVGRWPGWVIIAGVAGGALLLLLLVWDSLSDPNVEREISIADVDLDRLHDVALKEKVWRALEYVRGLQNLARRDTSGALGAAEDELPQLEEAVRSMYQLCLRLQDFRSDRLIRRDLADFQQKKKLGRVLTEDQEEQLSTLLRLGDLVHAAEQEIDSALAHLGQSYAEMQAIKVTPEFRGRAASVLQELAESAKRLSDLARGYDEVFGSRALPEGS